MFDPSFSSLDTQIWKQVLQDVHQTAWDTVAVRKHPHLQGAVCAAREDAIAGPGLHLHDPSADVTEDRLLSVFRAKRVHEPVAGQFPHLRRGRPTDIQD